MMMLHKLEARVEGVDCLCQLGWKTYSARAISWNCTWTSKASLSPALPNLAALFDTLCMIAALLLSHSSQRKEGQWRDAPQQRRSRRQQARPPPQVSSTMGSKTPLASTEQSRTNPPAKPRGAKKEPIATPHGAGSRGGRNVTLEA